MLMFTCEKQWSFLAWTGLDRHHLHLGPLPKKDNKIWFHLVYPIQVSQRSAPILTDNVTTQKSIKLHRAQFVCPHLLKKIFQQLIELVHQFVQELAAGDVYPVENCELFIAEGVVGLRAGLQHISVSVLLHNLPDLSQQWFQMLKAREQ